MDLIWVIQVQISISVPRNWSTLWWWWTSTHYPWIELWTLSNLISYFFLFLKELFGNWNLSFGSCVWKFMFVILQNFNLVLSCVTWLNRNGTTSQRINNRYILTWSLIALFQIDMIRIHFRLRRWYILVLQQLIPARVFKDLTAIYSSFLLHVWCSSTMHVW